MGQSEFGSRPRYSERATRPGVLRRFTALFAGAAVALGTLPVLTLTSAAEAYRPGNIDGLSANATKAPTGLELAGGEGGTGPDGDFSYSVDVQVPKGRKGLEPPVALRYSSRAAVHGGVAAGWTLSAGGAITVDPHAGSIRQEWADGGSAAVPRAFVSPQGALVHDPSLPVTAGALGYRAEGDRTFSRYEFLGNVGSESAWWRVYAQDGRVFRYGSKSQTPYSYAPLTSVTDGDGGQLRYTYTTVGRVAGSVPAKHPREFLLTEIAYWAPEASSAYAKVLFVYGPQAHCGDPAMVLPVGSTLDYKHGFGRLSGTRKLTMIRTVVASASGYGNDVRRDYQLTYNGTTESCGREVAPFRQLDNVSQTAYSPNMTGADATTTLPPVRFTYGTAAAYTRLEHYGPATLVEGLSLPESVDTVQAVGGCWSPTNPSVPLPGSIGCELAPEPADPQTCQSEFCAAPAMVVGGLENTRYVPHNLARAQSTGEGVTTQWVDINGDGLTDVLRTPRRPDLAAADNSPTTGGCDIDVYLNRGRDGFAKNHPEFRSFSLRHAMADVPVSDGVGDSGSGELLCTLSRSFSANASGGKLGVPDTPCTEAGVPSGFGSMQQVQHAFVDVDADGDTDLVAQPIAAAWCPYVSTFGVPTLKADQVSSSNNVHWRLEVMFSNVFEAPLLQGAQTYRQRYYYVYENTGAGFSRTAVRHRGFIDEVTGNSADVASVPRSSLVGAFTAPLGLHVNQRESVRDITGDGYADYVFDDGRVAPGKRGGGFQLTRLDLPMDDGTGLEMSAELSSDRVPGSAAYTGWHNFGLAVDVNGDGLTDHAEHQPGVGTVIRYNEGSGFGSAADGGQAYFSNGAADTERLESFRVQNLGDRAWQDYPLTAQRFKRTSMTDVDYDGIPDVLYRDQAGSAHKAYLGSGAAWTTSANADPEVVTALLGAVEGEGTLAEYADRADYRHRYTHHATDINGDGLSDLVEDANDDGLVMVRFARPVLDQDPARPHTLAPARLMRTVDNGYGAVTTIGYERDTAARKWVVNDITVSPGLGEPVIRTQYAYRFANEAIGPFGQRSFRGFGEHRALSVGDPATDGDDLTTVTSYDFSEDTDGLPVATYTVLGNSAFFNASGFDRVSHPGVMTVTTRSYHVKDLPVRDPLWVPTFPSRAVLPKTVTTFTCLGTSGQTAAGCEAAGARSTTATTFESHFVGSSYVMEKPVSEEVRFANAEDKVEVRRTATQFTIAWGASTFNVAPAVSTNSVTIENVTTPLNNRSYTYQDPEFRYLTAVTATDLTQPSAPSRSTRYQYYDSGALRGLVYRSWAPNEIGRFGNSNGSPGFSEFHYDVHGVTITRTKTPYFAAVPSTTSHHVVDTVVDRATGVTLETRGPDYVCADDSGDADFGLEPDPWFDCGFDAALHKARVVNKVDGLGRMRSVVKHPASAAQGVEVTRASYADNAHFTTGGQVPVSVVSETAVGDGKFSHDTTETDGLGRAVRTLAKQDNLADRVVTVDYDHSGRVRDIYTPRPDGPGTIGVRTTYDAMGRATAVLEVGTPEAGPAGKVLSTTVHDGLTTTAAQVVSDASKPAITRTTVDAMGQVVAVAEAVGPDSWATTAYRGDATGVTEITDPDGVETVIRTNGFGERVSITTGGKTWSYGYDRNGNNTTSVEPVPTGASSADFTHTRQYDAANRLVKEIPAPRGLDAAARAALKLGERVVTWDRPTDADMNTSSGGDIRKPTEASHAMGKVVAITSPAVRTVHRYDHFGNVSGSHQRVRALDGVLPGAVETERLRVEAASDATGNAESLEYRSYTPTMGFPQVTFDGITVEYGYDRDGTQNLASWEVSGRDLTTVSLANNAGVTTSRVINANNTSGFASPDVAYAYDRYGRLQMLKARNNTVQRYSQTLAYLDNGLIGTTSEQLGDTTRAVNTTTYSYDQRHQLTNATRIGGELSYTGTFTHSPGGRLASSQIVAQRSSAHPEPIGERVTTRNVDHVYNPANRQQLDKLSKKDLTDYSSFVYDEAGNTVKRTLSDGTVVDQVWDGPRLVKVTKPGTGESETYHYDGHQRVAAVLRNPDGSVNTARRWFGSLEVVHQPGKAPLYRQTISLGGETIARHDGDETSGATEHVVTSPQGHPVLALKSDGTTARVTSFGPYGEVLSEFTNLANLPEVDKYSEEFNGKTYDAASGLHYYGYRYYDSESLQWISADPLYRQNPDLEPTNPRSANLYTYTANNPVNFVDPNGLCTSARTGTGTCDFHGTNSMASAVRTAIDNAGDLFTRAIATPIDMNGDGEPEATVGDILIAVLLDNSDGRDGDGFNPRVRSGAKPRRSASVADGGGQQSNSGPYVTRYASTRESGDSGPPGPLAGIRVTPESLKKVEIDRRTPGYASARLDGKIAGASVDVTASSGKMASLVEKLNLKPLPQDLAVVRAEASLKSMFSSQGTATTSGTFRVGDWVVLTPVRYGQNVSALGVDKNGVTHLIKINYTPERGFF